MKLKPFNSGGIMLSYRCQCGCRHCVYACGPRWKDWFAKEKLENLFRGMREASPHINGFHLAGGEAFLNFELLLFAAEKAISLGIPIEYVETNAGWCQEPEAGREKLLALKEVGLRSLLISVSPFHAETIPLKRTICAIRTAERIFGPSNIIVYMWQFIDLIKRFSEKEPVPLSRWIETFGEEAAGELFWEGYSLIPGGRAGIELGFLSPEKHPATYFSGKNCAYEILASQHVHFDPYGNYIPLFCGGLSLGAPEDLPAFLANFDYRKLPLVKILVEEGPFGLALFAKENFAYSFEGKLFSGKCHLCVDVRLHLSRLGEFEELAPPLFYENLRSHLPPLEVQNAS